VTSLPSVESRSAMPKPTWPAPQMSTFMVSALQARVP
jgi:hypothetical protein